MSNNPFKNTAGSNVFNKSNNPFATNNSNSGNTLFGNTTNNNNSGYYNNNSNNYNNYNNNNNNLMRIGSFRIDKYATKGIMDPINTRYRESGSDIFIKCYVAH